MKKKIICMGIISMFLLMSMSVNACKNTTTLNNSKGVLRIDDDLSECPDADYTSIQDALDNEDLGDYGIIEVYKGFYHESIVFEDYKDHPARFNVIDKENTWIVGQAGNVITVLKSGISLKLDGFKIRSQSGSGNGIDSEGVVTLKNCRIEHIPGTGVKSKSSVSIENCVIDSCSENGIEMEYTFHNIISNNIISNNNGIGLKINHVDGTGPSGFNPAKIYHNDFINNGQNSLDRYMIVESPPFGPNIPSACEWDDGELGNFWSDYTGADTDNDGIGDNPYILSNPDCDQDLDQYPSVTTFNFDNSRPSKPIVDGPTQAKIDEEQEFTLFSTDADGEKISYYIDWGDGETKNTGLVESGEEYTVSHTWNSVGDYDVKVTAIDINGIHSSVSDPLSISLPKNKGMDGLLLINVLEHFPFLLNLFELFQKL